MRWRSVIGAALLLVSLGARAEEVDGIAAIVGEDVILRSEVDLAAARLLARVRAERGSVPPELASQAREEALRGLIDEKLIMKVAKRNNMEATEEDIDEAIQGIASDEGVSVDEIYAAVEAQGLTRTQYRQQLGSQLTRMRVVSGSVQSRINVSDEEVRELFQRRYGSASAGVRLRVLHILLPWPPPGAGATRESVVQTASALRAQALETGDFAGLARQFSAAPTAPQGGLTVFRRGEAPPAIENALAALSPGEISPPVGTDHGANLFQLIDRFDPSTVTLEQVQDQLRFELRDRKSGPEIEKWLAELRETQYIEIVARE